MSVVVFADSPSGASGSTGWLELDGLRIPADSTSTGPYKAHSIDTGTVQYRDQDAPAPLGDGLMFGEDSRVPPAWTLEMRARTSDGMGVLDPVSTLARAWSGDPVRRTPGAVQALRYHLNGRTRRVYGRPRRFTSLWNTASVGYVPVIAQFQLADHRTFGDTEESVQVGVIAETVGGWSFPLVFPLTTVNDGGGRAGRFTVAGDAPTPAAVVFTGPVTDPWADLGVWRVALAGSVPAGALVTVDARPGAGTITRGDGASVAGMYRGPRLDQLVLEPGHHEVTFGGRDPSGSARLTVAWRPAWHSL